jgi:hypothetical protein
MTALRQQAFDIIQDVPDDRMGYVIDILKGLNGLLVEKSIKVDRLLNDDAEKARKIAAWKNFQKFRGIIVKKQIEKKQTITLNGRKYG